MIISSEEAGTEYSTVVECKESWLVVMLGSGWVAHIALPGVI